MRPAWFLLFGLMAASAPAAGKGGLSAKLPKFAQADNGVGVVAAVRGADYLSRVIMHFAGLDSPLVWEQPPKSSEIFPDWVDEPVAKPVALTLQGHPACAEDDLSRLAAALKTDPEPTAATPRAGGLIRLEGPAVPSLPPTSHPGDGQGGGCIVPSD